MMFETWVDHSVRFTPYPGTTDDQWNAFFDALPEHYWERPDFVRRFVEPCISACERVVSVSALPWWMPKWWARRTVARIAVANGVGGVAEYITETVAA